MIKRDIIKEIIKDLEFFRYKHHLVNVLQDCFEMYAIALSNQVDAYRNKEREEEYLRVVGKYNKDEINVIASIFGKIIMLCQNPDGEFADYLGQIYMETETNSKEHGQFFTPYSVSQLMAKLTVENKDLSQDVILLNEPTCGSGGTIIALIEELKNRGIDISKRVLVVAQDIDSRCVNMAYIQFALMGIPAIIMKGDTLSYKFTDYWRTPAYLHNKAKFDKYLQGKKA